MTAEQITTVEGLARIISADCPNALVNDAEGRTWWLWWCRDEYDEYPRASSPAFQTGDEREYDIVRPSVDGALIGRINPDAIPLPATVLFRPDRPVGPITGRRLADRITRRLKAFGGGVLVSQQINRATDAVIAEVDSEAVDAEALEAILDSYTGDGVAAWLTTWLAADWMERQRLSMVIKTFPSGGGGF